MVGWLAFPCCWLGHRLGCRFGQLGGGEGDGGVCHVEWASAPVVVGGVETSVVGAGFTFRS